ncbi:MAG: radical SAM protein [Candidatus Omnitrophota bacterium]|nr:radical SAM protein [Candidatus Omnitrophota bacterium]
MKFEKSIFALINKVEKANMPFNVEWELTNRCNLDCLHCLRDRRTDNELSTEEIKDIFLQLRKENCFNLTFTGGEAFLRKDLFEILHFAKKLEFAISVYSNGTLLNEKDIKLLKKLNLAAVQISLYGATKEVHDSITRVRGSFDKTMSAIRLLKKHKVPFSIVTMAFNRNFSELRQIRKMAKQNKWDILFDFVIYPALQGDNSPLCLRTTSEQLGLAFKYKLSSWREDRVGMFKKAPPIGFKSLSGLHLSSAGKVYPSVLLRIEIGDLRKDTFHNIWHNSPKLKWLRSLVKEDFECFHCKWYNDCCWKIEMAYLEQGDLFTAPKEICRINRIFHEYKQRR